MNFLCHSLLRGLCICCFCLAGLVSQLRALMKAELIAERKPRNCQCQGVSAPPDRSTTEEQADRPPSLLQYASGLGQRAASCRDFDPSSTNTGSVSAGKTQEDLISSLSLAARSAGTSDKGPHVTSFLFASRHPPHNPYSPEKASQCILSRISHLTAQFLIFLLFTHSFIQ